jgi:hypothetical protein
MAYTVATPGGSPDTFPAGSLNPSPAYSGTFIPEVWSGKLIEKFYDATVIAAIANTDYEGEISSYGDKVNIRTKPSITIKAYQADQTLEFERPSSDIVELLIDKGYYFNTILDDVMEVQADLNLMSMWSDDASEQMKIQIDTEVLAYMITEVSADNQGTTAGRISGNVDLGTALVPLELVGRSAAAGETEVVDLIVALGQVLDEQNIPENGRWIVIPAWAAAMIKRSDLRDASLTGDSQTMLRNGRLGMIDRFELYSSNLLPTATPTDALGDDTAIIAGHKHGMTFASQLSKMETLRGESTFGNIMRGLQVYGRKVVDGTGIAVAYARKSLV